jgi:hypothetical protein
MAVYTELTRSNEVAVSEQDGTLSREQVTIASGAGALAAGTVLGRITASGKYSTYQNALANGQEVAAAVLVSAVDATSSDQIATVMFRLCELKNSAIVWPAGNAGADITAGIADLATKFIVLR